VSVTDFWEEFMRVTSLGLLGVLGLFLNGCGEASNLEYQVTYTPVFQSPLAAEETVPVLERIEIDAKAMEKATAGLPEPLQGYWNAYGRASEITLSGNIDAADREKLLAICIEIDQHAAAISQAMKPVLTAIGIKPGSALKIIGEGEIITLHGEPKDILLLLKIKTNGGGKVAGFELRAVRVKAAN